MMVTLSCFRTKEKKPDIFGGWVRGRTKKYQKRLLEGVLNCRMDKWMMGGGRDMLWN